jgi:hypothetical protein
MSDQWEFAVRNLLNKPQIKMATTDAMARTGTRLGAADHRDHA